jgi:hypothetical protein
MTRPGSSRALSMTSTILHWPMQDSFAWKRSPSMRRARPARQQQAIPKENQNRDKECQTRTGDRRPPRRARPGRAREAAGPSRGSTQAGAARRARPQRAARGERRDATKTDGEGGNGNPHTPHPSAFRPAVLRGRPPQTPPPNPPTHPRAPRPTARSASAHPAGSGCTLERRAVGLALPETLISRRGRLPWRGFRFAATLPLTRCSLGSLGCLFHWQAVAARLVPCEARLSCAQHEHPHCLGTRGRVGRRGCSSPPGCWAKRSLAPAPPTPSTVSLRHG